MSSDKTRGHSRRQFLKGAGACAAALAAGPAASAPQVKPVFVATGPDHAKVLARVLADVGVFRGIRRGDKVLLKVNTNSGDPFPYSTNPQTVKLLASRLRDMGARVTVGDRSFWGDPNTRQNLERNGIAAAAKSAGARVVAFEDETVRWRRLPARAVLHWTGPVRVPAYVLESDRVFNLACIKTHFITSYTMALKNFLGVVHPEDRARPGNLRSHHPIHIYPQIAEIARAVPCHAHIIDGFKALVTGGPTPASGARPTVVTKRVVLASKDPVAADAVGVSLLRRWSPRTEDVTRTPVWKNPVIRAAAGRQGWARGRRDVVVRGPRSLRRDVLAGW